MSAIPASRPLVVDEAYYEYCGESAALLDDGVVVIRTLSKAFALAGARVGYLIAERETARELHARHAPAPISTLSASLAVAVLAEPPDVQQVVEERERLAERLHELGLQPLPSSANFLYVPLEQAGQISDLLLAQGMVIPPIPTPSASQCSTPSRTTASSTLWHVPSSTFAVRHPSGDDPFGH